MSSSMFVVFEPGQTPTFQVASPWRSAGFYLYRALTAGARYSAVEDVDGAVEVTVSGCETVRFEKEGVQA